MTVTHSIQLYMEVRFDSNGFNTVAGSSPNRQLISYGFQTGGARDYKSNSDRLAGAGKEGGL